MADLDLIVIGAGMAGINAAARAAGAGSRVAVIERDRVGGLCVARGCIPTKALIRSAEVARDAREAGGYGVRVAGVEIDYPAVIDRVQAIVHRGSEGARRYLEGMDGVRLLTGEARFVAPGEVAVDGETLRASRVVVATGSEPSVLPIPGLEETGFLTSDGLVARRERPDRLLVIGAGAVGLELGQALSRLGSRVAILERSPALLPHTERDVADALAERLEAEGVEVVLGADIGRVAPREGGGVRIALTQGGSPRELDGDAVLLGAGRHSTTEALRLGEAGIDGGPTGIPVDARLRTSRDGHYAAGDVLGRPFGRFTHVARELGREAAENALALDPHDVTSDHGPVAIFTDPELVTIGLTADGARGAGHEVSVASKRFSGGKARAWGREEGMVTVVAERGTRRLLGAHVLAYHASDLIHPVAVAMRAGSADPLLGAFHIHPTLGETVRDAVAAAVA